MEEKFIHKLPFPLHHYRDQNKSWNDLPLWSNGYFQSVLSDVAARQLIRQNILVGLPEQSKCTEKLEAWALFEKVQPTDVGDGKPVLEQKVHVKAFGRLWESEDDCSFASCAKTQQGNLKNPCLSERFTVYQEERKINRQPKGIPAKLIRDREKIRLLQSRHTRKYDPLVHLKAFRDLIKVVNKKGKEKRSKDILTDEADWTTKLITSVEDAAELLSEMKEEKVILWSTILKFDRPFPIPDMVTVILPNKEKMYTLDLIEDLPCMVLVQMSASLNELSVPVIFMGDNDVFGMHLFFNVDFVNTVRLTQWARPYAERYHLRDKDFLKQRIPRCVYEEEGCVSHTLQKICLKLDLTKPICDALDQKKVGRPEFAFKVAMGMMGIISYLDVEMDMCDFLVPYAKDLSNFASKTYCLHDMEDWNNAKTVIPKGVDWQAIKALVNFIHAELGQIVVKEKHLWNFAAFPATLSQLMIQMPPSFPVEGLQILQKLINGHKLLCSTCGQLGHLNAFCPNTGYFASIMESPIPRKDGRFPSLAQATKGGMILKSEFFNNHTKTCDRPSKNVFQAIWYNGSPNVELASVVLEIGKLTGIDSFMVIDASEEKPITVDGIPYPPKYKIVFHPCSENHEMNLPAFPGTLQIYDTIHLLKLGRSAMTLGEYLTHFQELKSPAAGYYSQP